MTITSTLLEIKTRKQGLHLVTDQVIDALGPLPEVGLVNIFIEHTSASLLIQENASPSARQDLESFFERLAPEKQSWHKHLDEGPDDTTSHLKSALTQTFLQIPIVKGRLALGTWQGIYLFEHRQIAHTRNLRLTVMGS